MKSIRLITPYFKANRAKIITGISMLILVDMLQLTVPRIVKWAIDDLTALRVDSAGLLRYAAAIAVAALFIGVLRYIWRRCLIGTSRIVEEGVRNRLFEHLQTLSADYYDKAKTGDLMAHATNDIQHIRMASGMGMVALTDALVMGTAAIGFMAYIHPTLTFLVLIPMPLIAFGSRFFSRQMHQRYQATQAAFAELTEAVRERFTGIRVIKAHAGNDAAAAQVAQASRHYLNRNIRLARIVGSFFPMVVLFSNLSLAMVLFFGGRSTIAGTITPGDFVAFISYLGLLTWPMMALGWVTNLIQRGRASLERVQKILDTRPLIADSAEALAIAHPRGRIDLHDLSFYYPAAGDTQEKAWVLRDIRLRIDAGSMLGIVGPPGSGKTTLLSLVCRLYDPQQGGITFDGTDLRRLKLADLRRQIAFVPQEPFLFAGTIRDNLLYGNPQANEDQLHAALDQSLLLDTVQHLPKGIDTIVGEKGVMLSGGQKLRVALARAFLRAAPVFVLDDPISQVDMETGEAIVDTIRRMTGKHTLLIASHRLSALRFADNIIALDDGRVVETGTHHQLLDQNGYYAHTWHLQAAEITAEQQAIG